MEYNEFGNYRILFLVNDTNQLTALDKLVNDLDKEILIEPNDLCFSVSFSESNVEFNPTVEDVRKIISLTSQSEEAIIKSVHLKKKRVSVTYNKKLFRFYSN